MSERVRFIEHNDRRILLIDFSHRGGDDPLVLETIEAAKQIIAARPRERTVLTLVDATGSTITSTSVGHLKRFVEHNTPWVLACAVVGVTALMRLFFRIITTTTGRRLAALKTMDGAKDWLVAQKAPPSAVPQDFVE